ncbi:MAG: hypothetical protein JW940_28595 [Polyangiaceae bacterium]|nr:hypothetical protein [Polyangiaceae bacterium]
MFIPDGDGGSYPLEPLDPGPTSTEGALAGAFAVSERGLATYTIPIVVPPGRAGMQPEVSLEYSGTRVDGPVGVGWQITGTSTIERCHRIYALDGYTAPIENTPEDKFCLDGKRLVAVEGAYGADGTAYRTLVDSLSKIVSYGGTPTTGPESFKVWTKQGRILEYTAVSHGSFFATQRWMLDTVRDRSDNTIKYFYRAFGDARMVSSISYTGHGAVLGTREVRFEYEDEDTSPDKRTLLRFTPGGESFSMGRRLSAVRTVVGGQVVRTYKLGYENGINGIRRVQQVTECERAGNVSAGDACKNPTTFDYYEFVLDDGDLSPPAEEPRVPLGAWADLNGDGFADRLVADLQVTPAKVPSETVYVDWGLRIAGTAVSIATELPFLSMPVDMCWGLIKEALWGASDSKLIKEVHLGDGMRGADSNRTLRTNLDLHCPGTHDARIIDLDGDGMDDVVEPCPVRVGSHGLAEAVEIWWSRATGNTGVTEKVLELAPNGPQVELPSPENHVGEGGELDGLWLVYLNPEIIDLNGDGLPDLLYCLDSSNMAYRLNRPAFDNLRFGDEIVIPGDGRNSLCTLRRPYKLVFDVDGDGTPNLVRWNRDTDGRGRDFDALVMTAEGLQWKHVFSTVGLADGQGPAVLGDFNGDQLMDIYQPNAKAWLTGESVQVVHVNQGTRFSAVMLATDEAPGELVAHTAFDLDHDGRDDVLAYSPSGVRALLRQIDPAVGRTSIASRDLPDRLWNYLADLDGDGSLDVIDDTGLGGNDETMFVFYGGGARTNLLKTITDGEGNRITVDYDKDESGTPVYTFDKNDCAWPRRCVKQAAPVVSQHTESVACVGSIVKKRKLTYRYTQGRMDQGGLGWLGFKSRQVDEYEYVTGFPELRSQTTIEYKEPIPLTMDGAPATPQTDRYFYPFAGLVEHTYTSTPELTNGLMDEPHHRALETNTDWGLKRAYEGTLFPVVEHRTTAEYDIGQETWDPPAGPSPLSFTDETYSVDWFGNVILYTATRSPETRTVQTTCDMTPAEIAAWLISNPDAQQITSAWPTSSVTRSYGFTYYDNGLPWTVTRAPGDPSHELTTTYTYDEFGNAREVLQGSRVTGIDYDQDDVFAERVTNSLGQPTELRTDARFGRLAARVDPNGIAEQWAYDGFGRTARAKGPNGTVATTLEPSDVSVAGVAFQVRVTQQETGDETTYGILPRGQTGYVRTRGFEGAEVWQEYDYDALGRLTSKQRPHLAGDASQGSVSYEYDALDRLTKSIDADGRERHYEYASTDSLAEAYSDAWIPGSAYAKEIVRVTDEEGSQTATLSNRFGNVVRTIDAANVTKSAPNKTDMTYGPFNTVSTIRDNLGHTTGIWYDAYGRTCYAYYPDSGQWDYAYTAYDELRLTRDPAGAETTFTYDSLGRLTQRDGSDGTSRWVFDGTGPNEIGRLVETIAPPSASNPDGHRVRYAYEPPTAATNRGLLQSVTQQFGASGPDLTTSFERDAAGRAYRVRYPAPDGVDVSVRYAYDGPYVTSVASETGGSEQSLWALVQADQGYRIGQESFGATGATTEYQYDEHTGQVEDAWTRDALGSTVQHMLYTYYYDGNVGQRAVDRAGQPTEFDTYEYDERNRLTDMYLDDTGGTQHFVYGYDDIGNITEKPGMGSYTYDPSRPHLAVSAGSHAYSYDTRGNLASRSGPSVPGEQQLIGYTSFDLPSTITTGTTAPVTTHLEYDADQTRVMKWTDTSRTYYAGNLYRRTVDETTGQTAHHYLVYVGSRQVAEIVRPDGDSLPSTTYALYDDRLGSATTITDGLDSFYRDYAPFGDLRSGTFDPAGVITGFTGHDHDAELGLIDMKGRVYDPSAGRFLSADPFMDPTQSQTINPYSYVGNDPLNATDPSGFLSFNDVMHYVVGGFVAAGWVVTAGAVAYGFGGAPALAAWGSNTGIQAAQVPGHGMDGTNGGGGVLNGPGAPVDTSGYLAGPGTGAATGGTGVVPGNIASLADRGRLAATEFALNRLMFGPPGERDPLAAAQLAVSFWDARVTDVYTDPNLPKAAETVYYFDTGATAITFNPNHFGRARCLLSTAGHESVVHVRQFLTGQAGPELSVAAHVNELEALDFERGIAPRLGLSKTEISDIEDVAASEYRFIKGTPYQRTVDQGIYTIR